MISGDERDDGIATLGNSEAAVMLRAYVKGAQAHRRPILLKGPRGCGHLAVAKAIAASAPKAPFVRLHAARLQDEEEAPFLSLELDGSGIFEKAAGGTLFLDGLEELPLRRQAQLRRLLGSQNTVLESVRLIAGIRLGGVGGKRIDLALLDSLDGDQIRLPTLQERQEDIPELALTLLRTFALERGVAVRDFDSTGFDALRVHQWTRHLSELAEVVEHAVLTANKGRPSPRFSDSGASLGGYRLIRKLGAGGHGEVWEGEHRLLKRGAAIKIVNSEDAPEHVIRTLFEREAQVTARLTSPHTVTLFDFALTSDGSAYYVMELLKGVHTGMLLDVVGALAPERAIYLLRQACRSLIEAHSLGLVHRDIKHGNLFVCQVGDEFDFLKVLDFGVVKVERSSTSSTRPHLTLSDGGPVGTVGYIAPEIISQRDAVDHRADIYSLGCVAFELLTCQHVFEGDCEMALTLAHIQEAPSRPSEVLEQALPTGLDEVVLRCLEKKPSSRFQTAAELDEALEKVELSLEGPWDRQKAREAWRASGLSDLRDSVDD